MKSILLIRPLNIRQISSNLWALFSQSLEQFSRYIAGDSPSKTFLSGSRKLTQNLANFVEYLKSLLIKVLLFLSLLLNQSAWARDVGAFATRDFNQVEQVTQEIFGNMNPEEVLVVFDIDNTLLRLHEDLGSEQWFMWQRELIDKGTSELPAVTNSVDNLLAVQTWIYNTMPMEVVAPQQRTWIRKLRNNGTSVISLTSRSLSVHEATIREIYNNSLPLSTADELGFEGEGQVYYPYRVDKPEESGLSLEDIVKFKLNAPKPALFDQGVFFTQGQHKGVMLKTLLARMARKFKAVVFIDDRQVHIDAMRVMASLIPQNILSVHFNLSELWTIPFFEGTKSEAQQDWCNFAKFLDSKVFPDPSGRIYRSCD